MRAKSKNLYLFALISFFIFSSLAVGADVNTTVHTDSFSKEEFTHRYLSSGGNTFIKSIRYLREYEHLLLELKQVEKKLKKATKSNDAQSIELLENEKKIIDTKLQLLKKQKDNVYLTITNIVPVAQPFNLINFFSQKPMKEADESIHKLLPLQEQLNRAMQHISSHAKELKLALKKNKDALIKQDIRKLSNMLDADQRYLNTYKDLLSKQHDFLLETRNAAEQNYYEYRDTVLMKHIFSVVFLFALVFFAYLLKKINSVYIENEDQQFVYRRVINTSVVLIGIVFVVIVYAENVLYSLTVFTFVGAAIIIASREFLINIVAWVYIAVSNFIKIGDRILVPHETKYYYGDVIEISPVKITLYEAYDFSSTREAVSAGRIIFIPNNYIFSHAVISYSHQAQKTIFDHISFRLSFDSDLKRAEEVVREVLAEETQVYLDDAREQFGKLKKRYDVKQRMLDPEVQFVINPLATAVKMTVWYAAPSIQTTSVKNSLLDALLKRFSTEKSIHLSTKSKSEKAGSEDSAES
ncbi:mechanosensitive ion channel family protein [bacterium]|nr:mechanosensitive ion channel family protein [bacterium]MBU1989353.1 mechanosensitive ion channel family protein [bacterium]